jgi:hypothetical protein
LVVNRLDLAPVATSTFSFEEVEGEFGKAWEQEVSPDTLMVTVDAWNMED